MRIALTHKGWFGICPVYFGDLDTGCPLILERSRLFMPLMVLTEWIMAAAMFAMSVIHPDWEPMFPLRVTGELQPGREVEVPSP